MIAIQLCRGDCQEKESSRIWAALDLSLLRFIYNMYNIYCVYRPHLNCIMQCPILLVSPQTLEMPGAGYTRQQLCHWPQKGVWLPGRLLFRSKIILRGLIGSEQSVRYSELGDCPLLGGS